MSEYLDYYLKFLTDLLAIPSPTGNTDRAMEFVKAEFERLGIESEYTYKRSLIATIKGHSDKALTFSAHVDTLGAMVKSFNSDGRIVFHRIGGYPFNTIEGENVQIETGEGRHYSGTVLLNKSSVHVHPEHIAKAERDAESLTIRLDEHVKSDDEVRELGISIGDFISIDPRIVVTESGYIKSRHLDDKAGVACLMATAKHLKEKGLKPSRTINFLITNYEEVGHGASIIPKDTRDLIAVDMAAPDFGQASDERAVTICAMDSTGAYDLHLRKRLVKLAEDNELNYVIDIYPFYGSDGSAALRAGHDIRVGLIGPGVAGSHTYERTHLEGLENTVKLMLAFATQKEEL